MDLTGSSPITPVLRPGANELILRANQRITAEVLSVAGEQITLSLQGVPIVAKLVSADQSAVLGEHQLRQFIVRDVSGQVVTLQLVTSPAAAAQGKTQSTQDIITGLLRQLGVEDNPENNLLARAVLSEHLVVSADLLGELRDALAALPTWGSREAQMAAALKAAGLPVSDGTLQLALAARTDLGASLGQLLDQLRSFRRSPGEPADVTITARSVLETLSQAILSADQPAGKMNEQLRQVIELLGRSIEYDLSQIVEGKSTDAAAIEKTLTSLAELRGLLRPAGHGPLIHSIDQFIENVRWGQFLNVPPEQDPRGGQWTRLDIPIQFPTASQKDPSQPPQTARLRVSYDGDADHPQINAHATHLVIQVDISPRETIAVNLAIAGKRAGVEVTASNQELCDVAQAELAGLSEGLNHLGYQLERTLCSVGVPETPADPRAKEINDALCQPVDLSI